MESRPDVCNSSILTFVEGPLSCSDSCPRLRRLTASLESSSACEGDPNADMAAAAVILSRLSKTWGRKGSARHQIGTFPTFDIIHRRSWLSHRHQRNLTPKHPRLEFKEERVRNTISWKSMNSGSLMLMPSRRRRFSSRTAPNTFIIPRPVPVKSGDFQRLSSPDFDLILSNNCTRTLIESDTKWTYLGKLSS
jgi:hypothetical protein